MMTSGVQRCEGLKYTKENRDRTDGEKVEQGVDMQTIYRTGCVEKRTECALA